MGRVRIAVWLRERIAMIQDRRPSSSSDDVGIWIEREENGANARTRSRMLRRISLARLSLFTSSLNGSFRQIALIKRDDHAAT